MALKTLMKAAVIAGIATLYFNRHKATRITDPDGASASPISGAADGGSAGPSTAPGGVGLDDTLSAFGSSRAGSAGRMD